MTGLPIPAVPNYRIILDVDEEAHARYQLAADRGGFSLLDWIRAYLDAASDPESGADTLLSRSAPDERIRQ